MLYALAIEDDLIDDSLLVDEPVNINGYKPRNWYKGYKGMINFEEAIALSVNTIPVKILYQIGVNNFKKQIIASSGITSPYDSTRFPNNLTLALGSGELSPLELASIYTSFLNLGVRKTPRFILRIENLTGEILYENTNQSEERVLSEDTSKKVVHLLRSVVEHKQGTSHWILSQMKKNGLNFPVAAKTGTVRGYPKNLKKYKQRRGVNDVWYIALVPNEVNLIWFGHDKGFPFLGSGGSTGAKVWLEYAINSLKNNTPSEFAFSTPPALSEEEEKEGKEATEAAEKEEEVNQWEQEVNEQRETEETNNIEKATSNTEGENNIEKATSNTEGENNIEKEASNTEGENNIEEATSNMEEENNIEEATSNMEGENNIEEEEGENNIEEDHPR